MDKPPLSPNRYLLAACATALLVLAAVAAINAWIDPYAMFSGTGKPGFNAYKPGIFSRVRLLKAYEVRRNRPDSILLGSSRSHLAFRPAHEGWARHAHRRYNLAFDGATTKEMYLYLRHAQAVHPLKQALLCLDGYHPSRAPGSVRPGFDPSLLLEDGGWTSRFKVALADARILTSFSTLMSSYETVRSQDRSEPLWLAPDGQRLGEAFFRRPGENFREFGPRYYFEEINRLEVQGKMEWKAAEVRMQKAAPSAVSEQADAVTSIGYVEKIIDFCRKNGIELIVLLTPAHAHQLEIAAAADEWSFLEHCKRELVEVMEDDARRYPELAAVPLYDFSGYSSITMEPLPRGTWSEMQYYWDSSHFKENVGDLVLDRTFGTGRSKRLPEDFGVRLDAAKLERELQENRERREDYRRKNPEEVRAIRTLVSSFKEKYHIP